MADDIPSAEAVFERMAVEVGQVLQKTRAIQDTVGRLENDKGLQAEDIRKAVGAGLEGVTARLEATVASVTRRAIEGAVERIQADNAKVVSEAKQARAERWISFSCGGLFGIVLLGVLMKLLPAAWLAAPLAVQTIGGAIPAAEAMLDRGGPGERRSWRQAREIYGRYSDQLAVCVNDAKRRGKTVKCSMKVGLVK